MISATKKATLRCAIYTRRNTSEGLDAEITSLDVQRQASEAYVQSQAQEGWACLPEHYDDGGFSGADLKRPAMEKLLADIEAGHIDVVVVYKVDRLSRSLLDFARLVSVFDQHGVAFVAVTQLFNTRDSMGRLTLNILLSFAQFERELIAERTRDKIAMARRRGRWSGGTPPLGYDLADGQLAVNPKEARRARAIFKLYLESDSLAQAVDQLNRRQWHTKRWMTKKGQQRGGRPFRKNTLHHLLTNIVYLGKVRHKQDVYNGRHEPLVDQQLFERVQQRLSERRPHRRHSTGNQRRIALLEGILYCRGCGRPMEATYTTRGSRRYPYYVCCKSQSADRNGCAGTSLPAAEIERFVTAAMLEGTDKVAQLDSAERKEQINTLVERIDYDGSSGELTVHWNEATGRERRPTRGPLPAGGYSTIAGPLRHRMKFSRPEPGRVSDGGSRACSPTPETEGFASVRRTLSSHPFSFAAPNPAPTSD